MCLSFPASQNTFPRVKCNYFRGWTFRILSLLLLVFLPRQAECKWSTINDIQRFILPYNTMLLKRAGTNFWCHNPVVPKSLGEPIHTEGMWLHPRDSDLAGLGWGLIICISGKFPGDTNACAATTLGRMTAAKLRKILHVSSPVCLPTYACLILSYFPWL